MPRNHYRRDGPAPLQRTPRATHTTTPDTVELEAFRPRSSLQPMRSLPLFLLLGAVIVWRLGPAWIGWAYAVSGLALVATWILVARRRQGDPWLLGGLAGLAALVAASKGLGWWSGCGISCQGAGAYRELWGVSVHWLAVLPLVGVAAAAIAWGCRRSGPWPQVAVLLSWFSAGCSLYFIVLLIEIGIQCPHCLATHTVILALPACTPFRGDVQAWLLRLAIAGLGLAGLHWAYHPAATMAGDLTRREDPIGELDEIELRLLMNADRGRRLGQIDAPLRATLVIDMACPHCREAVPALLDSLAPVLAEGRLQLVMRHRYAPAVPSSKRLALLAMAAAAARQYRPYLVQLLGTRAGVDEDVDRLLPGELAELATLADDYARPLEQLLRLDRSELSRLEARTGPTPQLILRRGREELGRWQGEIPSAAVLAAIAASP